MEPNDCIVNEVLTVCNPLYCKATMISTISWTLYRLSWCVNSPGSTDTILTFFNVAYGATVLTWI